jgi:hypothetical protein
MRRSRTLGRERRSKGKRGEEVACLSYQLRLNGISRRGCPSLATVTSPARRSGASALQEEKRGRTREELR